MSTINIRKIASGLFSQWALLVLQIVVSLFMTPFVITTLDNTYFGLWVTLMQFTGYLYLLDFGLRNAVVHRTAQAISGKRSKTILHLISASIRLSTLIALLSICVVGIMALFVPAFLNLDPRVEQEAAITIFIAGCTIAIAIFNNPYEGVVRGFGLFLPLSIFGFFALIIRTSLTILLLLMGYKIIALAFIQFIVGVINAIFVMFLAKRSLSKHGFVKRNSRLTVFRLIVLGRNLWRFSWSILIDNMSRKLIFTSDTIVIGLVLGVPLVTFYAIASQLIEHLRGLIETCMSIFIPVASKITVSGNTSDLNFVLLQGGRFIVWFSLPVITLYLVLGKTFIHLWIGAEYSELAGTILMILCIGQMISLQQYVITVAMRSLEKHHIIGYLRLLEAAINIILSVIFAYQFGVIGVAIGTAVSQAIVGTVILPRLIIRLLDVSYRTFLLATYARSAAVCAVIGVSGFLIDEITPPESLGEFFMVAIGLGLGYVILSYFWVFHGAEREQLRSWLRRRSPLV